MKNKFLLFIFGLSLLVVSPVTADEYVVKKGDTLWGLFGNSWAGIALQNGISDPRQLQIGQVLQIGEGTLGAAPLPSDNYDTFLTLPLSATATTTFVNALPVGVSSTIYTIFGSDGVTPREKIFCTGTSTSPNKLTNCTRGISFFPVNGVIDETAGTGLSHSKNSRIAITDNINFSGKALSILNGSQITGANQLRLGDGTTTTDKCFIFDNSNQNVKICRAANTSTLYWTVDGINTYAFASSSISQLSASTTQSILLTNSEIRAMVSSTGGLQHSAIIGNSTTLQIKSGFGVSTNADGLNVATSSDFIWSGTHSFQTTTMRTTTITSSTITQLNFPSFDATKCIQRLVAVSSSPLLIVNDNAEYTVATGTFPGGCMGTNGVLMVSIDMASTSIVANNGITFALKIGGTTVIGTRVNNLTGADFGNLSGSVVFKVFNINSQAIQNTQMEINFASSTSLTNTGWHPPRTIGTATVDTSADTSFSVSVKASDVSVLNTWRFVSLIAEIIR